MADVKYDFAADVTAAERAIARLEQKQAQLEAKLKQGHRTSKRGQDDFVSGATKMIGGLVSVTAAVGTVTRAYGLWQEKMSKARQEQERFNETLLSGLVGAGLLAQGPRIRNVLRNLPGVTEGQGAAVFEGITSGAPDLTPAQAIRATRDFSRLAPLFTSFNEQGQLQGAEQLKGISQLRGRVRQLAGDELTPDDVTDLTLALHQGLGGRATQATSGAAQVVFNQLRDQGLSIDRSLAVLTEASQEGLELGNLKGIVAKAKDAGLTFGQLFAMDPQQRRELLGVEQSAAFARLDKADIDAGTQRFAEARAGDLAKLELARARGFDPEHFFEQQTQFQRERADRAVGIQERARQKLIDRELQEAGDLPVPGQARLRQGQRRAEELLRLRVAPEEELRRQMVPLRPRPDREELQRELEDVRTERNRLFTPRGHLGGPQGGPPGLIMPTQDDLARAEELAVRQVQLLESIDQKLTPAPLQQARRINRDAQIEGVPLGGTAGF